MRALLERLSNLYEATYERDAAIRKRAVDFAKSLVKFSEQHPDLFVEKQDGFITDATLFWKDPAAKGVYVFLRPAQGAMKGGLGKAGNRDIVVLPFLKGPGDLTHIATRLGAHEEIIVHEVIHLLDPGRDKAKELDTTSSDAYYNHPGEWNAFWQEGVSKVEKSIENMDVNFTDPEMRKKFIGVLFGGGTFQGFIKKLEAFWNKDFLNGMNSKTRRKFDKRLFQLWNEIKDRLK